MKIILILFLIVIPIVVAMNLTYVIKHLLKKEFDRSSLQFLLQASVFICCFIKILEEYIRLLNC